MKGGNIVSLWISTYIGIPKNEEANQFAKEASIKAEHHYTNIQIVIN